MQDLNDKITGGVLTAAEWNEVPSEIQNVIEKSGITLSGGDLDQLGKAIANYVGNGDFYTDSGAADTYVLTTIGSKQAPSAYTNGMRIRFVAGNGNTGASTVNVASLGVKSLRPVSGSNFSADDIIAGTAYNFYYDGTDFLLASQSLFSALGTGAVPRTPQAKAREIVSITDFGAAAGAADSTAEIQAALNITGGILFPDGIFTVDPLTVSSNTNITFSPNTVLKAKTGYGAVDNVFLLHTVNNVVFHGNFGTVQMLKSEYTTGESRHCIRVYNSTNVDFYDLNSIDSGGDGFSIGGGANETCYNINLYNCVSDNHRRNALAITNVIGCNVIGGEYKNTNGTAPEFGIDVEPNPLAGYEIQGVNLLGVRTTNNDGGGISVVLPIADNPVSVNIRGHLSDYDGRNGGFLAIFGGLSLPAGVKMPGRVTYRDASIINAQTTAILIQDWTDKSPDLVIENVGVVDVASNVALSDTSTEFRCGVLHKSSSGSDGVHQGEFTLRDIDVRDTRGTVRTTIPLWLKNDTPGLLEKNIVIENLTGNAWTDSSPTPIFSDVNNVHENVLVKYKDTYLVDATSSISNLTGAYIGAEIGNSAGASITYNLPLAADALKSEYSFVVDVQGFYVSIGLQGTDIIEGYAVTADAGIRSLTVGARITVKAISAGTWRVVNIVNTWASYV